MKNNIYILLLLLVFVSCEKENQLNQSVFKSDPELPELPEYSEWGYNTFGAFYERGLFIYSNHAVPAKVINTNNQFVFMLTGYYSSGIGYYESQQSNLSLKFIFNDRVFEEYSELVTLHDTRFNLKNPMYKVVQVKNGVNDTLSVIGGEIYFKRAQNLLVDKNPIEVILSGYFEVQLLVDGIPITISDGRFDVGISKSNFFNY